jgi:branched-chain amino acid transport system substrate-binding protein
MIAIHRRSRTALVMVAAIAIAAAGCSSSSKNDSSNPPATSAGNAASTGTSTSTSACKPTPTGSPLSIGVISSDTGTGGLQGHGDAPAAVKAWKDYITCQGGIAGHPVDITYIDDQSNPANSVQAAETLISDHVIAIMDNTAFDAGWQKQVDAAHIPVLGLMAAIQGVLYSTDSNFYANQTAGIPTGIWAIAKAASLGGAKKVGLLYCVEVPGCAALPKLVGHYATMLGMNLVYSASYSQSQPSYTALCLAAKAKGVDVLIPIGTPQQAVKVYDDCAQQGYKPTAVSIGQGLGNNVAADKANIPEIYGASGTLPYFVRNDATKAFYDALGSYIDSSTFKASNATASGLLADWVGLQMFAKAAANVGASPTSTDIVNGLLAFNGETLGGLSIPLTFTQGHPRGDCMYFYEVKDGTYSVTNGGAPACLQDQTIPS